MGLAETKEASLGKKMDTMGDFNDIIGPKDKQGGRRRLDSFFIPFRAFINTIEMEDVPFKGRRWTWANNRAGEGFIEERLDMVFGSAEWLVENGKAEVQHFSNIHPIMQWCSLTLTRIRSEPKQGLSMIIDGAQFQAVGRLFNRAGMYK